MGDGRGIMHMKKARIMIRQYVRILWIK